MFSNGFPSYGNTWVHILSPELQLEVRKNGRRLTLQDKAEVKIKDPLIPSKSKSSTPITDQALNVSKETKMKFSPKQKTLKTDTERRLSGKKKNRRVSEPSIRTKSENTSTKGPSPHHTTRSGRKIYPPLAFWENVYLVGSGVRGEDPLIIQADTPDRLSLSSRLALNSKSP